MRLVPPLAAVLVATACGREHAAAQRAEATVQVAATVVESAGVRVDATAATVADTRDGVWLAAPLAVSGAGSPSVEVASDGGECRAVSSTARAGGEPAGPWLRCSVPRRAEPGGVTEIRVTLVIVPAT
jgi:hypothetical protein